MVTPVRIERTACALGVRRSYPTELRDHLGVGDGISTHVSNSEKVVAYALADADRRYGGRGLNPLGTT
jgi:hypothetical protein